MQPLSIFLAFFAVLQSVLCQTPPASDTAQSLPSCAASCAKSAYELGICDPTDQVCSCTNVQFMGAVGLCVQANCTIIEALQTQNVTATSCGAPVRSRTQQYHVISNIMSAIGYAATVIRFVFKLFIAHIDLALDDYLVLATVLICIPGHVMQEIGTIRNGIGTDIWTRTPQQISNILMYLGFQAMLYYVVVSMLKLCLLAFYLRIFPAYWVRKLLQGTMLFVIVYGISFVIAASLQCRPLSFGWKGWDGQHKGSCNGYYQLPWVNAGVSIALDIWMLAIPLWMLRSLQLHWKKKLGVALMFCVGTFSTIISIIRVKSIIILMSQDNVTWEYYGTAIWSSVEVAVGIICVNMPVLRQALVKAFPRLGSGTTRSGTNPQTPSQSKRKSWPVLNSITNRSRNERIPSDSTDAVPHGTAQFVDAKDFVAFSGESNDKARLVEMNNLSPRHERSESRNGWTDLDPKPGRWSDRGRKSPY